MVGARGFEPPALPPEGGSSDLRRYEHAFSRENFSWKRFAIALIRNLIDMICDQGIEMDEVSNRRITWLLKGCGLGEELDRWKEHIRVRTPAT
jgi:hypothetical protein